MGNLLKISLCILMVAILSSCSHTKKSINNKKASEQAAKKDGPAAENYTELESMTQKLDAMIAEAQNNEAAIKFLATDLFLKANMSLMDEDFYTASVLFKYVGQLVPDDEFVQKKLAISLIRVGDLEQSQEVLEKLYKKSSDAKVGLILAGVYTGLDLEQKAQSIYKKILAKNPKNEDACVFLSKSYAMVKRMEQAFLLLSQCAQKDPKNGMYDYYTGKIYLDLNNDAKAIEAFKRALVRQPDFAQAINAIGMLYEEREQFDLAIKTYESHLKKHPFDETILNRIVHVLFVRERFTEVISYAERLSDLEPDNLNLKVKLGVLYTDAKKYPEAVSAFKDLLAVAPESDKILYYLGAIYQEMGNFESAIDYFNQIPVASGLYTDSSVQVANMLSSLAQAEFYNKNESTDWKQKFLAQIKQKIEELPELRIEFSVILSGYYESVNQFKDAMETMMVVQDEKGFSTQHKYYLANLYEKERKYEESNELIMGVIDQEPKNAEAWNFMGYTLLVRGEELDKAYEFILKAYNLNPNDGYIRDSLGWYYYKKGDIPRALKELKFAISKVPDDVEILKHLAIIYRDLKDFKKARAALETAMKHARFQSDRDEISASIEKIEKDRKPASGK